MKTIEKTKTFYIDCFYFNNALDTYKIKAVSSTEAIKKAKNKIARITNRHFAEQCEYINL